MEPFSAVFITLDGTSRALSKPAKNNCIYFLISKGERRQIFRDEVDHLKGVNRPVESNYGFYEPQEEQYDRPPQPSKPVYQDDYRPEFPQSYRPTFQVHDYYILLDGCWTTFWPEWIETK